VLHTEAQKCGQSPIGTRLSSHFAAIELRREQIRVDEAAQIVIYWAARARKGGSEADKPNKKHKPGSSATASLVDVGTTLGDGQEAEYEEFIGKKLGGRVRITKQETCANGVNLIHLDCFGDLSTVAMNRGRMCLQGWEIKWLEDFLDHYE
jgi:hypothetical protein